MKKIFMVLGLMVAMALGRPAAATAQDANASQPNYKFDNGKMSLHRDYVDKALKKKMKLLEHYLDVLIAKKRPNYLSMVDSAMILFNNDESKVVTVTSKNTGKRTVKPVKEYLTDVARLPYKSVHITYRNYSAIQNIRRQPDGTYKGVVVLQQEFTGFDKEGNAVYSDAVKRNIEVTIGIHEYYKDPKDNLVSTDIFFGNMGVTEVKM